VRSRSLLFALLVTALFVALASSASAAAVVRVSDERTDTTWAYVRETVKVRAAPSPSAKLLARLRPTTYVGWDEVVLVLARTTVAGRDWALVRHAGFGSPRGWLPADALGRGGVSHAQIVVDRRRRQVTVYVDGRARFRAPAGVGARGSPTPTGRTFLRERLVPSRKGGIYGVLAFGLGIYTPFRTDWPGGGQVGLHGTNEPGLIPGLISNGCVRLRNRNVLRLDRIVGVGTPVLIR
jgi:hypothetical protein